MASSSLSLLDAYSKAEDYLTSAEAARFGVRGLTIRVGDGLVEFRIVDGVVVGEEVAA